MHWRRAYAKAGLLRAGEEDWLVVSFHTVAEDELIEERPDPGEPDPFHPRRTRRRKYLEVKQP